MESSTNREFYRPHPDDLDFVQKLGLRNAFSLGYLPAPALQRYANRGNIIVARENGEPAGYLVERPVLAIDPRVTAIIQTCVVNDARRLSIASDLLQIAHFDALKAGTSILQAWCATDLESNAFWSALSFANVAQRPGGRAKLKRRRYLNCWRRRLDAHADIHDVKADPRRGPGGVFIQPP